MTCQLSNLYQVKRFSKYFKYFNKILRNYATRQQKSTSNTSKIVKQSNLTNYKMWIFGYGSLVWKVDFPIDYKITGHIKGYFRRFYQHSTDHRGTPDNPGRVVTLIPSDDPEACVWGVAYKIHDDDVSNVIDHLDYREKGGYRREQVTFYPKDATVSPFDITIYVGTSDNFQYAGEADLESIALQVYSSVGPSGSNVEYVCNLAKAMREIAPDVQDDHLFGLEGKVLELIHRKKGEEL